LPLSTHFYPNGIFAAKIALLTTKNKIKGIMEVNIRIFKLAGTYRQKGTVRPTLFLFIFVIICENYKKEASYGMFSVDYHR